jgi:tetratricopeptide (TPR) repeat protein
MLRRSRPERAPRRAQALLPAALAVTLLFRGVVEQGARAQAVGPLAFGQGSVALATAGSQSAPLTPRAAGAEATTADRGAVEVLLRRRRWAEAVELLDLRIAIAPAARDLIARGNARAELGRLAAARDDFVRAAALAPDDPEPRYRLALARLAEGDDDGFRRACAALLWRFGATADPKVASPVAYTCVARPRVAADPAALVRLGEVAAPLFRGNGRVTGAALYRAGRYDEAARRLEESARQATPVAWDWLFLAMAHHRLGHAEVARGYLDRAARWITTADAARGPAASGPRTSWHSWNERAEVRALYREAEALLGGGPRELPADAFARPAPAR